MKVKLTRDIEGWVGGVYHPQAGMEVNVEDKIGEALCGSGRAQPVDPSQEREAAVINVPENAAEATARPKGKVGRRNVRRT